MKSIKTFNTYFENSELFNNRTYSGAIVKSLVRSILEPITAENAKAIAFTRLKNVEGIESLIKRLEYLNNIELKQVSDFEFSKFDVEEIGFIVLNSPRYNCAFLFKEIEKDKFEIYLKFNSKLVYEVYETIKKTFLLNSDELFYQYKPERRDNLLMNDAILNILNHFEETIEDGECNLKIQESYKNVNTINNDLRNEVYQNVRAIAHEIKNQLSILDIYARIFEKKLNDTELTKPIRKSVEMIKKQLEQFKNIDVVNLQEKDIKEILAESIQTYSSLLKEKNNKLIFIDELAGQNVHCFVDSEKILIVINNIIKNAHESTKNDEITIKLSSIENKAKISFINHGQKIKQDDKEKIFEENYTTKKDGWGVGLSVCKKFIGSQFGSFYLEKSEDDETIFSMLLPMI